MDTVTNLINNDSLDELLSYLYDNPALQNQTNKDGRTLLQICIGNKNVHMARALMSAFPEINVNSADSAGWTALHQACSMGDFQLVELLASSQLPISLNAKTKGGQTALHYAAGKGHIKIVEKLINLGIDLKIEDKLGQTALHRAATLGQNEVVLALLSKDPSIINWKDHEGNTALHLACEEDHEATRRLLLEMGADHRIANAEGEFPKLECPQ